MNAIRCPQCGSLNSNSAAECGQCHESFQNLSETAYVSVSPDEFHKLAAPGPRDATNAWYDIPRDNEYGKNVHFWYRIYCGIFIAAFLIAIGFGINMLVSPQGTYPSTVENGQFYGGVFYVVLGLALAPIYIVALLSPRKPWAWTLGMVLSIFGLITCCFLPSLILIIYWTKPETRVYFGRSIKVK
jgi:hypothetical protein